MEPAKSENEFVRLTQVFTRNPEAYIEGRISIAGVAFKRNGMLIENAKDALKVLSKASPNEFDKISEDQKKLFSEHISMEKEGIEKELKIIDDCERAKVRGERFVSEVPPYGEHFAVDNIAAIEQDIKIMKKKKPGYKTPEFKDLKEYKKSCQEAFGLYEQLEKEISIRSEKKEQAEPEQPARMSP